MPKRRNFLKALGVGVVGGLLGAAQAVQAAPTPAPESAADPGAMVSGYEVQQFLARRASGPDNVAAQPFDYDRWRQLRDLNLVSELTVQEMIFGSPTISWPDEPPALTLADLRAAKQLLKPRAFDPFE